MLQKLILYIIGNAKIGNYNLFDTVYYIFRVTNVTLNEVDQPLISDVIEVSAVSIHYAKQKQPVAVKKGTAK